MKSICIDFLNLKNYAYKIMALCVQEHSSS